jgi:hypothetical protein
MGEIECEEEEFVARADEEQDSLSIRIRVYPCLPRYDDTYGIIIVIIENAAHVALYRFVALGTSEESAEV